MDNANFDRISHVESAKEAWDILVKYYEGGGKVKGVKLKALRRKYELLQMGEDEKTEDYVLKMQNLVHLMKRCGENLTDKTIVENVMWMLTSQFDHVIMAIQESNNIDTLKLKDLFGSLRLMN